MGRWRCFRVDLAAGNPGGPGGGKSGRTWRREIRADLAAGNPGGPARKRRRGTRRQKKWEKEAVSAFYVTRKSKRRAPVHGLPHVDFCNALEAVLRLHGGTLVEYCHQALLVDHLSCGRIIIWLGRPRGELVIRALGVVTESGERATVSAIWDLIWVVLRSRTYIVTSTVVTSKSRPAAQI